MKAERYFCQVYRIRIAGPVTFAPCQVWRHLLTIVHVTLKPQPTAPDFAPTAPSANPPPLERQGWDEMGSNGTGNKNFCPTTPEEHQFSFASGAGMGKMGQYWEYMGKIQSRFSRAAFPLMLGQVSV